MRLLYLPLFAVERLNGGGGLKIPVHWQFYSCFREPFNARIKPGFRYEICPFSDLLSPHLSQNCVLHDFSLESVH